MALDLEKVASADPESQQNEQEAAEAQQMVDQRPVDMVLVDLNNREIKQKVSLLFRCSSLMMCFNYRWLQMK